MLCRKGVAASAISIDRIVVGGHLFIGYFSTFNDAQISSNHYQVLGIGQQASQEEIKKAFFTLSKKYHPDMLGSNSVEYSTQKFLQIREAYDTLRDEKKRREYDQQLGKRQKWSRNAHYWGEEDDWELNHRMAQNRENIQHQQKWRQAAERPPFSGYGPSFRPSSSSTRQRSNEIPTWSSLYHIWRAMVQEQNSHRFQQTVERNNRNTANRNYPTPEEMKAERKKVEQQRQQNWWAEYRRREQKQSMGDALWSLLGKQFHVSQLFIIVLFIIFLIKYE